MWNWVAHLRDTCPKPLLLMNLDETGVSLFNGDRKGTVRRVTKKDLRSRRSQEPTQQATRTEMRGQATHVAIICDDASVQPLLPQVVVGDHHLLPARVCRDLQQDLPDNVCLLRLKSRWTDKTLMAAILRGIAAALEDIATIKQPVLLLDTAPSHLDASTARLARRLGILLVLVPARTTWLLQPCDTHVFLRYKAVFRHRWLQLKSQDEGGKVSLKDFWSLLVMHVAEFMTSRDWREAFSSTGYEAEAMHITDFIKRTLKLENEWALPPRHEPTTEDVTLMLPRRRASAPEVWLPPSLAALQAGMSEASLAVGPAPAHQGSDSPLGVALVPTVEPTWPAAPASSLSGRPSLTGGGPSDSVTPSRALPALLGPMTRRRSRLHLAEAEAEVPSAQPGTSVLLSAAPIPESLPSAPPSPCGADGPISGRTRSRRSGSSTVL